MGEGTPPPWKARFPFTFSALAFRIQGAPGWGAPASPALPGEGSASRQRPGDASIKPPTRLPAAGRVGEAVTQRFLGVGDQVARCSPLPALQQGGSAGRDLWWKPNGQ